MCISTQFERVVGTVAEIREFGAIVKLPGGRDGLLHETRVAGGSRSSRKRRLASLRPSESVVVDIIEVKREGKRTKISLSELWRDDDVLTGLQEGSSVQGVVVHMLDCGLIVSIADGVASGYDGFTHVSELVGGLPKDRDKRLAGLKLGDTLELEVLRVAYNDRFELSIKLSEKAVAMRRKLASSFAVGTTHTGSVSRRVSDGYVVSFGDFSGFLPERELAGTSAGSIRVGGRVKTKVLAIEGQRVTLTRRGL